MLRAIPFDLARSSMNPAPILLKTCIMSLTFIFFILSGYTCCSVHFGTWRSKKSACTSISYALMTCSHEAIFRSFSSKFGASKSISKSLFKKLFRMHFNKCGGSYKGTNSTWSMRIVQSVK